jgi:hypothetical protein
MPKMRGIRPADIVRLDLSDGDWIDVKRELTGGEERECTSRAIRGYFTDKDTGQQKADLDPNKILSVRAALYIHNWSLTDLDGRAIPWPLNKPLDVKLGIYSALDRDTMAEIDDALVALREAEDAKKKPPSGASGTTPVLPSRSISAGPTKT